MMEEQDGRESQQDRSRTLKTILLVAMTIVVLLFFTMNSQSVEVSYIFDDVKIPLVWALFAALALGFVAGWLTRSFRERD